MDLETKCPHCDQWTALNVESCSKCGRLLHESKEEAATPISSFNKKWQLVIGLAVGALILSVIFPSHTPNPPREEQAQAPSIERQNFRREESSSSAGSRYTEDQVAEWRRKREEEKPDLSRQLGFYGQWDKDKDGYLKGAEIVAALTELNNAKVMMPDVSGKLSMSNFAWEPPRMDLDLDQRLSREELKHGAGPRAYHAFKELDLNKDDLLSKAEFEKIPLAVGVNGIPAPFESLVKFDLNQDGKLALLEIPPYHSFLFQFNLKPKPQGNEQSERAARRRKEEEERSGNNNVDVGRGRPIIESMTLSTDTIIGGGEVTVTIKIRSEIPIVLLNRSLSGPMEDQIYGGGRGERAKEIRRGEWIYQWTDKISKFLPSGVYTYSGVRVRDEARRYSEEWKDVFPIVQTC